MHYTVSCRPIARQRLRKHILAVTNTQATIEKLPLLCNLAVFSMDPSRDYINSTKQNENGASPRRSRKKGSAEGLL
jgi:hypothetical protein